MERRLTEEVVTKSLLNWLESNGWEIICYDFPQSGTGVCLHPNAEFRTTKNKDSFIPDIVAHRDRKVVFFENKDRFVLKDFDKVNKLRTTPIYSDSIAKLLRYIKYDNIFYGVGVPLASKNAEKCKSELSKVDFIAFCDLDDITLFYDPIPIF